jgi:hypothetical protein
VCYADCLRDGDQKNQEYSCEYACFDANQIAAQRDSAKREKEDLREIDIDQDRHKGENQNRAESEKPDGCR